MNAVIDEDLPRSFGQILSRLGFTPLDIRDHGLRGASDQMVYKFAQKKSAVLFTADLGFSNVLDFPIGTHVGICILRFPNELPVKLVNESVVKLLKKLKSTDFPGNLVILSPGKVRVRRPIVSS